MTTDAQRVLDWTIYRITNPEGRIYIGKTSDFKVRMRTYKSISGGGCNKQPILYNSLLKYGFDRHNVDILDSFNSTNSYANDKEMFWIRSFMSNLNKWRNGSGMNLNDGGGGNIGVRFYNRVSPNKGKTGKPSSFLGKTHSEEAKKKLSDHFTKNPSRAMLGKSHSDQAKLKMSTSKKGKESSLKGSVKTIESRIKSSVAKLGKPNKRKGISSKRSVVTSTKKQPILLHGLDGAVIKEFSSKREARRFLGIGRV